MEVAAHSAYDMFSKYKYLIVIMFFSHLGFWSRNFFLIAPCPDNCYLHLFDYRKKKIFTIFSSHYLDRKYTVYQFSLGQTNILHVHVSQA